MSCQSVIFPLKLGHNVELKRGFASELVIDRYQFYSGRYTVCTVDANIWKRGWLMANLMPVCTSIIQIVLMFFFSHANQGSFVCSKYTKTVIL